MKPRPRRRHPVAIVVLLLAALSMTGSAYATLKPSAAAPSALGGGELVKEGRDLFIGNCASCHGADGSGSNAGPSLIGVGAASVDFQVGTGRMPLAEPGIQAPRGEVKFNDEQIAAIAAYVDSLGGGPGLPDSQYTDLAGADAARGGEIFRVNCAMCHNYAGAGGALTRGKYAPSLMGVDSKHMYEAMLTGPQSMPVFDDATLTPQDKEDVIAYLRALEEQPSPGAGLQSIGPSGDALVIWTFGIGLLLAAAVWITRKAA